MLLFRSTASSISVPQSVPEPEHGPTRISDCSLPISTSRTPSATRSKIGSGCSRSLRCSSPSLRGGVGGECRRRRCGIHTLCEATREASSTFRESRSSSMPRPHRSGAAVAAPSRATACLEA
eukprot:208276-Pleurochrysis_carterae.AAC.19